MFGVARNPFSRAVSSWSYSNLRFMRKDSRCIDTFQVRSACLRDGVREQHAGWQTQETAIVPTAALTNASLLLACTN